MLSRQSQGRRHENEFTERLIDITGDVRGQRIILAQKLKPVNGNACKTDCLLAQRIVNKDMLEIGEWNSNTAVLRMRRLTTRVCLSLRKVIELEDAACPCAARLGV